MSCPPYHYFTRFLFLYLVYSCSIDFEPIVEVMDVELTDVTFI